MYIANPIYDAVFKYLLEDGPAARLVVGGVTGLDVRALEARPQETTIPVGPGAGGRPPLTLLRMDFAARVRTGDGGLRQVLIEIQKAPAPTVILRFRKYLARQLASGDNLMADGTGAVPIVTVYFLGYALGLSDEAVVDVFPHATERRTGRSLDCGHPFLAGIHHCSHIVQIPHLRGRRRDDLERLLAVFDQGLVAKDVAGSHLLSIDESDYPDDYAAVLRRLRQAGEEEAVRRTMEAEDELLRDSVILSERAERAERRAAQERQRAEQERQRAEQERQRAEQAEDAIRRERRESARRLAEVVRQLHDVAGLDAETIARRLAVDVEEVRRALAEHPR